MKNVDEILEQINANDETTFKVKADPLTMDNFHAVLGRSGEQCWGPGGRQLPG